MSSEVSLGSTVAGFRVERLIGRGAMGAVYLTEDVHLRRKVALKVLAPELSMKNVYDGVVTTDRRGNATVRLPRWFQALNRDFRYQLTPIGDLVLVAVERELAGNSFTIRSAKPHMKVSWQVTGIRHDSYANAHRIRVVRAQACRGTGGRPVSVARNQ